MNGVTKIGFTQGVFDLLHYGHIKFLETCAKNCDQLIVGVISDRESRNYKRAPFVNENERLSLITQIKFVHRAYIVECRDPIKNTHFSNSDIFFWGTEWRTEPNVRVEEQLNQRGVSVIWVPRWGNLSSSKLREIVD